MSFKRVFIFGSLLFALNTYAMDDQQLITLQTLDKEKFKVEVGVAKLSETLKNLLQDADITVPLDLPNMSGATLATILELLKIIKTEQNPLEIQTKIHTKLSSLTGEKLIDFIVAVNFLDIPVLLSNAIDIAKSKSIRNLPLSFLNLPKEIRHAILYAQARDELGVEQINQSVQVPVAPAGEFVFKVLILPNNKRMAVVFKQSVRLFDIEDIKNVKQIGSIKGIYTALCITPDGSKIMVKEWGTQKIRVFDSNSLKELAAIPVGVDYALTTLSTDGSRIVAGVGNDVYVWNSTDGALLEHVELNKVFKNLGVDISRRHYAFQRIYARKDGTFIIACSYGVLLWDLATFKVITVFKDENYAGAVCLSLDQNTLVLFNEPNMITIIDLSTKQTRSFNTDSTINTLAITPDGTNIVGVDEKIIHIWDLNGTELQRLVGHKDRINAVQVTPDGMHLVSGSSDATLRIWDIPNFELLFKNMSLEQARQVFEYLRGKHAAGWNGIRGIFGIARQQRLAAEPLAKKCKK